MKKISLGGLRKKFGRLHKNTKGLEALEYLLVAALVIVAAIGAYKFLGQTIKKGVADVADATQTAVAGGIESGKSEK